MIGAMLEALVAHWTTGGLDHSVGAFYPAGAPTEDESDYCTYRVITAPRDWASGVEWQDANIQISVWTLAGSQIDVLDLADLVTAQYDNAALNVTGGTLLRMDRTSGPIPVNDPDGGWQAVIEYTMRVEVS